MKLHNKLDVYLIECVLMCKEFIGKYIPASLIKMVCLRIFYFLIEIVENFFYIYLMLEMLRIMSLPYQIL